MATSGSYNLQATAAQIVQEALEMIGTHDPGESITGEDMTSCMRTLNYMTKQWVGRGDFAPGLKVWTRKVFYVFLQDSQIEYTLGPTGTDKATESYSETAIRVAASATDTTIEVDSTSGMTAADVIGIRLNSDTIHWTTVASVTDGDTVVITSGIPAGAAAAVDKEVYWYTTALAWRPVQIDMVSLRDSGGSDTLLAPMTREAYEAIPSKTTEAAGETDPARWAYEDGRTDGKLYLDAFPSNTNKVLRVLAWTNAEDYDATANDIAFPQHWYAAIAAGLAKRVAPKFAVAWTPVHEDIYNNALMMARSWYPESSDQFFQPGCD